MPESSVTKDDAPENPIRIGTTAFGAGGQPLLFIFGPCVIETEELIRQVSERLAEIGRSSKLPSFSNRVSTRPTGRASRAFAARVSKKGWRFSNASDGPPGCR